MKKEKKGQRERFFVSHFPPHPDVDAQDGDMPRIAQLLHQRVVLVGGRLHGERLGLVPRPNQPGPPGTKDRRARCFELLDHLREVAKRLVHLAFEFRREGPVFLVLRAELVEIEEVVVGASPVVADSGARRRQLVPAGVSDDARERRRVVRVGRTRVLQRVVEVGDVGREVLAVVIGYGAVGDGRLEGVGGVGERDDLEGRRRSCRGGGGRRRS